MLIKILNKHALVAVCIVLSASGCRQMIKADMDAYLQNKEAYRQKKVVFRAELQDLLERYELYKGRQVEISAPVTYSGREGFSTWYLMLEKDGSKIRAYEEHYRDYVNNEALALLDRVNAEGSEITVRGKLKKEGIEIKELAFQDSVVDTDFIPPEQRRYWRGVTKPVREYNNSWYQWNMGPGFSYR